MRFNVKTRCRWQAAFVAVAAFALGFLLHSARGVEVPRSHSDAVLASPGHHTTIQARARQRTAPVFTCVPALSSEVVRALGRNLVIERPGPRSLDPFHVNSGRSPPPSLS